MGELLTWVFAAALKLKREVEISWAMAKAELTPFGSTPGLCEDCGYGLDDHSDEGECPEDEEYEEIWAIDCDDEEDWEDDNDGGGGT